VLDSKVTGGPVAVHAPSLAMGVGVYGRPQRVTHADIHPRPRADCPLCPATACVCGAEDCPDAADHYFAHASAETSWREVASR